MDNEGVLILQLKRSLRCPALRGLHKSGEEEEEGERDEVNGRCPKLDK